MNETSKRKNEILPYFDSLHSQLDIPILYVTHSQDEASRLADHLMLIEDGNIIGNGPGNASLQQEAQWIDLEINEFNIPYNFFKLDFIFKIPIYYIFIHNI